MNKGFKERIHKLYSEGKNSSEIVKILGCTKSVVSFHLSMRIQSDKLLREDENKALLEKIKSDKSITRDRFLSEYGDMFTIRDRRKILRAFYPTVRLKIKTGIPMDLYHRNRRNSIKKELIDYKGGSCQICGYNKSFRALHFHHIDSKSKVFSISKNIKKLSLIRLYIELDKCVLLCANCHCEVHDGLISVSTKVINGSDCNPDVS